MPKSQLSIAVDRLHELRERRGFSRLELSRLAGFSAGHLRRIEKDSSLTLLAAARLAEVLEVDIDYFIPAAGPRWTTVHSAQREDVLRLMRDLYSARGVLTCTQGMESYLQDDKMVEWTSKSFLRTPDWELADHRAYIRAQKDLRDRSSFVQRIICRGDFVRDAVGADADLVGDFMHRVDDCRSHTLVGLIDRGNWSTFDQGIRRLCPLAATGWDKLSVADDFLAVLRIGRYYYHYTYHGPTVAQISRAVDDYARIYVPYKFPVTGEIYSRAREQTTTYAVRRIQEELRKRRGRSPRGPLS